MDNSTKIILSALLSYSAIAYAQQVTPSTKQQLSASSVAAQVSPAWSTNTSGPIYVFVRGKDRAYTPEEIVNRAKAESLVRSPTFSFVNAEVVVSIDAKETNRLAAVIFSHGFGHPMVKVVIGYDGTVAAYTEGILQERTSY